MTLQELNTATKVRFYEAIDALMERGDSKRSICLTTGIDRRNLHNYRNENRVPSSSWLSAIVIHYGVSAEWLLVGKGKMFAKQ